jgi:hypothetical protein
MDEVSMPYLRKTYYALALDPVHIGSGEMQMGRVDNPIVRDAASNLPKIPATSLAGVARTYTAMHYPEKYPPTGGGEAGRGRIRQLCRPDRPHREEGRGLRSGGLPCLHPLRLSPAKRSHVPQHGANF